MLKSVLYGNTVYKHICTYHFLKDEVSSGDIKQIKNKKLGGES